MSLTDLLATLASARVYDLEQPRYAGAPTFPAHEPGVLLHLHRRHEAGLGAPDERVGAARHGRALGDARGRALPSGGGPAACSAGWRSTRRCQTPYGFTETGRRHDRAGHRARRPARRPGGAGTGPRAGACRVGRGAGGGGRGRRAARGRRRARAHRLRRALGRSPALRGGARRGAGRLALARRARAGRRRRGQPRVGRPGDRRPRAGDAAGAHASSSSARASSSSSR